MHRNIPRLENNLRLILDSNPEIVGLKTFKKQLEKCFFSNTSVRNCSSDKNFVSLIIEMNSNFDLSEALYFLEKTEMGGAIGKNTDKKISVFSQAFTKLKNSNSLSIDIEEFVIFFKNSSIFIKKIYQYSIPDQLKNISKLVIDHYEYYTKQFSEVPFEIHIPLFEVDYSKNSSKILNIISSKNTASEYYKYWGLYFDSNDDDLTYDLENLSIIDGDLYLLDH